LPIPRWLFKHTLDNLQIKGDLDDIKKRHLIDLMSDMRGVITTLSETSNFTESSRQGRIYENSLIPLNQSLEKSYSLAKMLLEDRKVTSAIPLISLYGQLATLKKQVLVELGQVSVANSFQQDADLKLSSLQEAKKVVCGKILATADAANSFSSVLLDFINRLQLIHWDWSVSLNVVTNPEVKECKKL